MLDLVAFCHINFTVKTESQALTDIWTGWDRHSHSNGKHNFPWIE